VRTTCNNNSGGLKDDDDDDDDDHEDGSLSLYTSKHLYSAITLISH